MNTKPSLRSLKSLDAAAANFASAFQMLLDDTVLRKQLFERISPDALALAAAQHVALWNTSYMAAGLNQLDADGSEVKDEDVAETQRKPLT